MTDIPITKRIYLDAALQNIKSVAFFTFLNVLIARLGASDFQIALANFLPQFFCAISLALITRQLPVTRTVFLASGYVRQAAFLSMALSVLLPHPIPYLLFFWSINAISVMITSAQQPAIMRRWLQPHQFPAVFSMNKSIGIAILVVGSFVIGHSLDAFDRFFPYNYVVSMLVGCLSTFTGMALIAGLAPNEKTTLRFTRPHPLRESNPTLWWMALNNFGIAMVGPLFTIYHVKTLHLSNTQIGYFTMFAGLLSFALLPFVRRWMDRSGPTLVYGTAVLGMALTLLPYGFVHRFWLLAVMQAWIGVCTAVHEVSSQSMMMNEAGRHHRELDYFSDFQLLMNGGNAFGALTAGLLVGVLPLWACFTTVGALRLLFFGMYWLGPFRADRPHPVAAPSQPGSQTV